MWGLILKHIKKLPMMSISRFYAILLIQEFTLNIIFIDFLLGRHYFPLLCHSQDLLALPTRNPHDGNSRFAMAGGQGINSGAIGFGIGEGWVVVDVRVAKCSGRFSVLSIFSRIKLSSRESLTI